ncbi:AEC family transporter [Sedimentitalea todarodis]|uniref:Permease n=1 Tax=Sedimentitalea todarodis TaxID=1631240 RepID=A0ABU3VDK4_9RHOB|nr:hypothetical protein [Sedimentitalea todarodis]MDU9004168.1 hypothetical protein [Sedimentitalea todarodis]
MGNSVLHIAMPALLFRALATRDFAQEFQQGYVLAYLGGGLSVIVVAYLWFTLKDIDPVRRALAVMGRSCSNSGFVGYPIMLLAFPDVAGIVLALNMLVKNIPLNPLCLVLIDFVHRQTGECHGARLGVSLSTAMPMFGLYVVFAQEQGLEGAAPIAMLVATSGGFLLLNALMRWLI